MGSTLNQVILYLFVGIFAFLFKKKQILQNQKCTSYTLRYEKQNDNTIVGVYDLLYHLQWNALFELIVNDTQTEQWQMICISSDYKYEENAERSLNRVFIGKRLIVLREEHPTYAELGVR